VRRGARAAGDGLLVLAPRLAQVCVQVDQSRQHDLAGAVDRLALRDIQVLARLDDDAVPDHNIGDAVETRGRVDEVASLKQQRHFRLLPAEGT
jgi:hypothetical protein